MGDGTFEDALPRGWDRRRVALLRRRLLAWYRRNRRDLPWRRTADPYAIHVSEIMLQQTTVAAVVPYYERFLARFPDVGALADAAESDVLASWSGLGYYHRARRLRSAVREIRSVRGGRYPREPGELRRLPGVGAYTASAIASIAFGRPSAVVDGNVERVTARLLALDGAAGSGALKRAARAAADALLAPRAAGDFNQAMMELGATVCAPRDPRCGVCPLARDCRARALDDATGYPAPAVRRDTVKVHRASALVREEGRILLTRVPDGVANAGLLELPGTEIGPGESACDSLALAIERSHGLRLSVGEPLTRVRHHITHHRITLDVLEARRSAGRIREPLVLVPEERLADEPLTSATRKALAGARDARPQRRLFARGGVRGR